MCPGVSVSACITNPTVIIVLGGAAEQEANIKPVMTVCTQAAARNEYYLSAIPAQTQVERK